MMFRWKAKRIGLSTGIQDLLISFDAPTTMVWEGPTPPGIDAAAIATDWGAVSADLHRALEAAKEAGHPVKQLELGFK